MKTKKKLVRGMKVKDAETTKFPHAHARADLRQWAVIVLAAGFIGYFAPSVAGAQAQIKDAALLAVFGAVAWVSASYLPLPKLNLTNARKRGRQA
ncbi:MAG: hypothetical protein MPK31_01315 [Gammaproteobacteria bacterium]|nr:hypothetical protein [Gammaproteobacteria bacterium]MDA7989599.1 hypothetical protein [Gammaproteobacteria bacterium]MDA8014312.1 hypothetical protein [Gammaproteobacteria bacterium]MDA8021550.1 hypothetical protein [Gammaproteobacteria bacterium]